MCFFLLCNYTYVFVISLFKCIGHIHTFIMIVLFLADLFIDLDKCLKSYCFQSECVNKENVCGSGGSWSTDWNRKHGNNLSFKKSFFSFLLIQHNLTTTATQHKEKYKTWCFARWHCTTVPIKKHCQSFQQVPKTTSVSAQVTKILEAIGILTLVCGEERRKQWSGWLDGSTKHKTLTLETAVHLSSSLNVGLLLVGFLAWTACSGPFFVRTTRIFRAACSTFWWALSYRVWLFTKCNTSSLS